MQSNEREYPEPGEYVIATVESIFKQGSFVTLDEYGNKRGMLPLSEISLKWVRNIRDYIKEGQKVVLMVLGVNPARGHIDLSLRRVTDAKRKEKLQQIKRLQRAEKLLDLLATDLSAQKKDVEEKIHKPLSQKYPTLYDGLEAVAADDRKADELGLEPKWRDAFIEIVRKNIKPPFVYIAGYVELRSYEPSGAVIIKDALRKIESHKTDADTKIEVAYISPPNYRVRIRSTDYKSAEKVLKNSTDEGIEHMHKHSSIGEFHRVIEETKK